MTELEEALEVFERDVNLDLTSTKIIGKILAREINRLREDLLTYGQHLPGSRCAPVCSCGFEDILEGREIRQEVE